MRAWRVHDVGEPEDVFVLEDVDEPTAARLAEMGMSMGGWVPLDEAPYPVTPEFAILDMRAAALALPDVTMARGTYPVPVPHPYISGQEGVGIVREASPGLMHLVGKRVVGVCIQPWGSLADVSVAIAPSVALAADGVVFERAYSHAPQTLPAHAALLSGQLPFEIGVRDNVGFTIKQGERLLPQMLRDRGFTTGGVVSSYVLRKDTGIAQGFDFFDGEMPASSPELSIGQVQRDGTESEKIAEHWLDTVGSWDWCGDSRAARRGGGCGGGPGSRRVGHPVDSRRG